MSYSDVFGIDHRNPSPEPIAIGDIVRTGDNAWPQFEVIGLHDDQAWLKNVQQPWLKGQAPLDRCRLVRP